MTASIAIERSQVVNPDTGIQLGWHLYLVFRPDGAPPTEWKIIRAGSRDENTPTGKVLHVNADVNLLDLNDILRAQEILPPLPDPNDPDPPPIVGVGDVYLTDAQGQLITTEVSNVNWSLRAAWIAWRPITAVRTDRQPAWGRRRPWKLVRQLAQACGQNGKVRTALSDTSYVNLENLELRSCLRRHLIVLLGVCVGMAQWISDVSAGNGSRNGASSTVEKEEFASHEIWDVGVLIHDGRPAGFYRLVVNQKPPICGALHKALSKPHKVIARSYDASIALNSGNSIGADTLLGNELSVKWTDLRRMQRSVVDLNGDGKRDVIYRELSYSRVGFGHYLYWTDSFPPSETYISNERYKKIRIGRVFEFDSNKTDEESVPPSPEPIKLPLPPFEDIVRIGNRHYIIMVEGRYLNKRLHLFTLESHSRDKHTVLCVFKSNFIVR